MVALRFDDRNPAARPRPVIPRGVALRPVQPPRAGLRPHVAILLVVTLSSMGSLLTGDGTRSGDGAPPGEVDQVVTAPAAPSPSSTSGVHLVRPGESYWSVAVALHDRLGGDVRSIVDALQAANGHRPLRVGDRLAVPHAGG